MKDIRMPLPGELEEEENNASNASYVFKETDEKLTSNADKKETSQVDEKETLQSDKNTTSHAEREASSVNVENNE